MHGHGSQHEGAIWPMELENQETGGTDPRSGTRAGCHQHQWMQLWHDSLDGTILLSCRRIQWVIGPDE